MEKINSLEEYQLYLRAMLLFFDRFCRQNGINYTVMDGTLLGAVRNYGMIPWDGDVDVAVTQKEFQKLKIAFESYKGRYYLNYFPKHYYKGKGMKKTYGTITAKLIDKKCDNTILGVDIFTIDFLGNDEEYAKETIRKYKQFFKLQRVAIAFHLPKISGEKTIVRNVINVGLRIVFPIAKLISIIYTPFFNRAYQKFIDNRLSFDEQSEYYTIEPYLERIGVERNTILKGGYINMTFDGMQIMSIKNYESYLVPTYGDYMKLPPEEKRIPFPSLSALMDCNIELDDEIKKYIEESSKSTEINTEKMQ